MRGGGREFYFLSDNVNTNSERVDHNLYLFNQLNYLYLYPYQEKKTKVGVFYIRSGWGLLQVINLSL